MIKNISILGCGWLGLPLGAALVKKGYIVKGSTTRADKLELLSAQGITPFQIALNPAPEGDDWEGFLNADLLIINIPPSHHRGETFHPSQSGMLAEMIWHYGIRKVIYVSSTSVYPDLNREVTEDDSRYSPSNGLLHAEQQLMTWFDTTVLRCGGLMGYGRVPGRYFAGKKGLTTGEIPVNFVYRDDVIAIIEQIIVQQVWNEIFNVVAPLHPVRREVYLKNAAEFGFEVPQFSEVPPQPFKIVSSQKLMQRLNYAFIYPDPLLFPYFSQA